MFLFKKNLCIKCKYITFSLRAISTGDLFIKWSCTYILWDTLCTLPLLFCGPLCSSFFLLLQTLLSSLTVTHSGRACPFSSLCYLIISRRKSANIFFSVFDMELFRCILSILSRGKSYFTVSFFFFFFFFFFFLNNWSKVFFAAEVFLYKRSCSSLYTGRRQRTLSCTIRVRNWTSFKRSEQRYYSIKWMQYG